MITEVVVPLPICENGIHTIAYIRSYGHVVRYCVRCTLYMPGDI